MELFLGAAVKIAIASVSVSATLTFLLSIIFLAGNVLAQTNLAARSYETTYTSILPNMPKTIGEAFLSVTGAGLTQISITTNDRITFLDLKIQGSDQPPNGTDLPSGNVYSYFTITVTKISGAEINDSVISSVAVNFKVPKAWLNDTSADKTSIALYRLDGSLNSWTQLASKIDSEDNAYVYYSATSPGLSTYAIASTAAALLPSTSATTTAMTTETATSTAGAALTGTQQTGIIAGLIIAAILFLLFTSKRYIRKRKYPRK